jgi:hypothetical protein
VGHAVCRLEPSNGIFLRDKSLLDLPRLSLAMIAEREEGRQVLGSILFGMLLLLSSRVPNASHFRLIRSYDGDPAFMAYIATDTAARQMGEPRGSKRVP